MDKKKVIYIGILMIITVIVSITYFSYAFFTHKDEQHGKLNIVAGTLNYKIESDDLNNNQITLEAGELKNIEIKLTSLNDIDSKYELYYETNNNVKVGCIGTIPKGTINKKEIKIFNIGIKNYSTAKTTVTFKVDGGFVNNELVKGIGTSIPIASSLCSYTKNQVFNFTYNGTDGTDGSAQVFDTDFCSGNYKVELWGAQGGGNSELVYGGYGGYTSGNIKISSLKVFSLYIGGAGSETSAGISENVLGGYNGGGYTFGQSCCGRIYGTGGGATDIRLVGGAWNLFDSLKSRIMVAGGGGGSFYQNYEAGTSRDNGGAGGGLSGYQGMQTWSYCYGLGGSQILGGIITTDCTQSSNVSGGMVTGGFGYGGSRNGASTGGGSGYYGGSRSGHVASSGGGSSFISGYSGCDAIAESSAADNIVHTGQANHYSGYVFTNGVMIDGKGCNWSTGSATNCGANQPQPDGTTTTGHTGNGYARITYLGN